MNEDIFKILEPMAEKRRSDEEKLNRQADQANRVLENAVDRLDTLSLEVEATVRISIANTYLSYRNGGNGWGLFIEVDGKPDGRPIKETDRRTRIAAAAALPALVLALKTALEEPDGIQG